MVSDKAGELLIKPELGRFEGSGCNTSLWKFRGDRVRFESVNSAMARMRTVGELRPRAALVLRPLRNKKMKFTLGVWARGARRKP